VWAAWSDALDGDLRPAPPRADALAAWVHDTTRGIPARGPDGPTDTVHPVDTVHWVTQVHGARVVVVDRRTGGSGRRAEPGAGMRAVGAGPADGLVGVTPADALAILTADCASVALGSPEGIFGAVHAGWRGLRAGVVEATVDRMRDRGAGVVVGALGPCIHPECYEFSEDDLATVEAVYGPSVRGRTAGGRPALDVPAAVSAALAAAGAGETGGRNACTGCDPGHFSHRRRGDPARQALAVWSTDRPGPVG
jgi:copper oxidase (laccase) domain-containing protein